MLLYNWIGSLMTYFAIFIALTIFFYFLFSLIEWVLTYHKCSCGWEFDYSGYRHEGKDVMFCNNPDCPIADNLGNKKVRMGK